MPNRAYQRGRSAEYKAIRILRQRNYLYVRSAGSHGPCDIVAAAPDGTRLLLQIKRGKVKASQEERIALKFMAARFAAKAEIWTFKRRAREPVIETL